MLWYVVDQKTTIMFKWLRRFKRKKLLLKRQKEDIADLKAQIEDYRELTSHCLLPVEQLAVLTDTELTDLKVWSLFGNLYTKKLDCKLYIPGRIVLNLLCEIDGSLHLVSRYKKPLIPSDVIKATASFCNNENNKTHFGTNPG